MSVGQGDVCDWVSEAFRSFTEVRITAHIKTTPVQVKNLHSKVFNNFQQNVIKV